MCYWLFCWFGLKKEDLFFYTIFWFTLKLVTGELEHELLMLSFFFSWDLNSGLERINIQMYSTMVDIINWDRRKFFNFNYKFLEILPLLSPNLLKLNFSHLFTIKQSFYTKMVNLINLRLKIINICPCVKKRVQFVFKYHTLKSFFFIPKNHLKPHSTHIFSKI